MGSAAHRKSEYVILQQPFAQPRVGGQYRRKVCASVCQRVPACASVCQRVPACASVCRDTGVANELPEAARSPKSQSPIARLPAGLSLGIGFCSFAYDGTS